MVSHDVHPDAGSWTPPRSGGSRCYSADLEFVVDTLGKPELGTAHVVRATDPNLGDAWLKTVPAMRFDPAMRNGIRVRQIVDAHFVVAAARISVPAGSPLPPSPGTPLPSTTPNC